jgi:hypothetical protein
MNYIITTIGGREYGVTQNERDKLAKALLLKKDERPAFIQISSAGAIIATSSITAITEDRSTDSLEMK